MKFKEFGNEKDPAIIILHGGGLSWWSLQPLINNLSKDYFVVTPVIDGHGEDGDNVFVSIEDSATKLIEYIRKLPEGRVKALCGLSIGAQIVVEVLSVDGNIAEFALIESALIRPMKTVVKLAAPFIGLSYPLIKMKWYSRLQAKVLFVPEDKLDLYYTDSIKISRKSLEHITISNASYSLKKSFSDSSAKMLILAGEKEPGIMIKSAKEMHQAVSGSTLQILPGLGHGELSLTKPDEYCRYLRNLIFSPD